MNVLIDTHILVMRENNRSVHKDLLDVSRLANDLNLRLVVHPLSIAEIEKDKNIPDSRVFLSKAKAYPLLDSRSNPYDDEDFFKLIPKPRNEREKVDCYLLYCLYRGEVDLFLTEDPDIVENAEKLKIAEKILILNEASRRFKRTLSEREKKSSEGTVLSFFKRGNKWYIGERGKEFIFDDLKGFSYIHYLLSKENRPVTPSSVYHLGKSPEGEKQSVSFSEKALEALGLSPDSPIYDKPVRQMDWKLIINKRMEQIEDEINSSELGQEDVLIKKEQIEKLNQVLKMQYDREYHPMSLNSRTNVTKSIGRALTEIKKNIPLLERYLNKSTIHTGNNFSYRPLLSDKPSWVLFPESNNQ